jgi:GDP-4-dehydro-6-deoxy-D-mannose reductase
MRVVVSGVRGFVGGHLARVLSAKGHTVVGLGREGDAGDLAGVLADYVTCDLTRTWPRLPTHDAVVHLASLSAVGPSFAHPQRYLEANSAMVTGLGEQQLVNGRRPRTIIVSSGAVYSGDQPMPIDESARLGCSSPYAVSKILVEAQSAYYRGRGLDWIAVRPFNHVGPGQSSGFLLPDLYTKSVIAMAEDKPLLVGDLGTRRDYTDVRDVCRAYAALLEARGVLGPVYNVCSGQTASGHEVLGLLMDVNDWAGLVVKEDESLKRPNEMRMIAGSFALLRRDTGWVPERSLREAISDFSSWASVSTANEREWGDESPRV